MVSSIGISTRPILSCNVKASTRLSRLSFTFFSKPEYVWMMYHCIPIEFQSLSDAENFEHIRNAALHQPVDHRQKNTEESHGRDHHGGRRNHILAARPGNLLHLQADIVQKRARILVRPGNFPAELTRPRGDPALFFVLALDRLRCHRSSSLHRRLTGPINLWQGRRDSNPHTRFWRPES